MWTRMEFLEHMAKVRPGQDGEVAKWAHAEIGRLRVPYAPQSLHWLGDREAATITQHAVDMTGCVMYFKNDVECNEFMKWLTEQAATTTTGSQ